MKRKKQAGSSLFLMELILVLFFFLLTSAVCIRVFAKAYFISRSSLELSHAQSLCASAAEVFSGTDGSPEAFLEKFPDGRIAGQGFQRFFDKDFLSCEEAEAVYTLIVEQQEKTSDTRSAVIRFFRETEIYSLTVRHHIPQTFRKEAGS